MGLIDYLKTQFLPGLSKFPGYFGNPFIHPWTLPLLTQFFLRPAQTVKIPGNLRFGFRLLSLVTGTHMEN